MNDTPHEIPDTTAILIAYGQARVERRHLEADQIVVDLAAALDAARVRQEGLLDHCRRANKWHEIALERAEAAERESEARGLGLHVIQLRIEAAEENLSFAQQRAADNGLRAEIGERKISELVAEIRDLKAARDAWSTKALDLEGLTEQLFDERDAAEAKIAAALASIAEHRDVITGRGRYPERINECHCEGCKMARVLTKETPNA